MLNRINQNPEDWALIDARRKALLDYNTNMRGEREKGHREGLVRGRKEGLEEGVKLTAKGMKQQGLATSLISQVTGLSEQQINTL